MNTTIRTIVIFALLLAVGIAGSLADERPRASWQSSDPSDYADGWLILDRNEDGIPDYAVKVDERGRKVYEAMDFNYDGLMDDFYFYANDVLQRQEIDTNADGRIDIWIYLRRGVYITMWERDRDFDGVIDDREEYGRGE